MFSTPWTGGSSLESSGQGGRYRVRFLVDPYVQTPRQTQDNNVTLPSTRQEV